MRVYPDTPSMLLRWLLQHGPLRGLLLQGLEALSMAREGDRRGLQRFQAVLQVGRRPLRAAPWWARGPGEWRSLWAAPCMRHSRAWASSIVVNGAPLFSGNCPALRGQYPTTEAVCWCPCRPLTTWRPSSKSAG